MPFCPIPYNRTYSTTVNHYGLSFLKWHILEGALDVPRNSFYIMVERMTSGPQYLSWGGVKETEHESMGIIGTIHL